MWKKIQQTYRTFRPEQVDRGVGVGLVVLAILVRWYRLADYLFFGFEQGRDAQVAMSIFHLHDFVLVGPKTDIGGVFHGAWYYYLMVWPYGLSGGNPLVASAFLIVLTSLVPVIMYWLAKQMNWGRGWAGVMGLLTVMSYEAISYSRWLSNVTPALFLVPFAFALLWRYRQARRGWWLVAAAAAAALSAQFEIILTLWWLWILMLLLVTHVIPRPSIKTWWAAGLAAGFWYIPMLLFNLRNQWISLHSVVGYLRGEPEVVASSPTLWSIISLGERYTGEIWRLAQENVVPGGDYRSWLVMAVVLSGLLLHGRTGQRSVLRSASLRFWLCWLFMSVPVMLFPRSLNLPQLYIGTGLAAIGLTVLGLRTWWQSTSHIPGKLVVVVTALLIASNWPNVLYYLHTNQRVFFRTIQDDLNYADQQALLRYMDESAGEQSYSFKAFTIPYFQGEGWQYLFDYHIGKQPDVASPLVYVIIEKPVDPFWRTKWTEELGLTTLVEERRFGLITLEKREKLH